MAVTVTTIWGDGDESLIADISWALDADTDSPNIPHLMRSTPVELFLTDTLLQQGFPAGTFIKSVDATNVVVSKVNVGAGVAPCTSRLIVKRPHTIGR